MKEKISCSLDGDMINLVDDIIEIAPYISSRSAFIEMAILFLSMPAIMQDLSKDDDACNHYMALLHELFEWRCTWNAQTESQNRNV